MRFMLDTDICIELIRKRSPHLLRRLTRLRPDDVCVSAITLSELEYGVAKSAAPKQNKLALAEFMTPMTVMPYDDQVADRYGRIRSELEARGKRIGPLDTMIAAHALALGLTLVTNNEREFRRVPDLQVENWEK
ncbi:MAG TPA: type II toxin-antitoxin system VapC family toxin [candidate division Zixibacteria bacterium]|nr:type II toxin-antitoxin system VapC family toxin [candidate division Zixibacteria bacterium]